MIEGKDGPDKGARRGMLSKESMLLSFLSLCKMKEEQ